MLVIGLTTVPPLEYVYDVAPEAVMVNDLPLQIEPLFIDTTGLAFTETKIVFDATQPVVDVPTTEYVVVTLGVTTILEVVAPFDQTKLPPVEADNIGAVDGTCQVGELKRVNVLAFTVPSAEFDPVASLN